MLGLRCATSLARAAGSTPPAPRMSDTRSVPAARPLRLTVPPSFRDAVAISSRQFSLAVTLGSSALAPLTSSTRLSCNRGEVTTPRTRRSDVRGPAATRVRRLSGSLGSPRRPSMLAASESRLARLASMVTSASAEPPNEAQLPTGTSALTLTWRIAPLSAAGSGSSVTSWAVTRAPTAWSSKSPEVSPSLTLRRSSTGRSASSPLSRAVPPPVMESDHARLPSRCPAGPFSVRLRSSGAVPRRLTALSAKWPVRSTLSAALNGAVLTASSPPP